MIDSILGADYDTADAVVIGVPYEHTASFGVGAINGPCKIKEVLDEQIEFFDRFSKTEPAYDYKFSYKEIMDIDELSPSDMVNLVSSELIGEKRFYVLLGGNHTVTIPSLKSLAEKNDSSEITVVQLDAHFDLREDDSDYNDDTPSNFAHCTVMRRAFEYGFHLLPVGIRTIFKDEYEFIKKYDIKYFEWGRRDITIPSIEEVIKAIPTEKVYLTIDVDGFDPSVMPATGTPVSGGISWEYGEALIREIMKTKEVIAADIVEVAPVAHSGQTEYNAGQIAYHILSLAMSKNV